MDVLASRTLTEAGGTTGRSEGRDYAAAVYGSLLVTTLLTVELRAVASAELIAFTLILSVAVFWLTHAWARIVDRRIRGGVGLDGVVAIARAEAPMLAPVVIPALVLGLAPLGMVTVDSAVVIALAASLVQLFLWGVAVGRAAHSSWPVSVAVALVDLALGLLLVGLKVAVIH